MTWLVLVLRFILRGTNPKLTASGKSNSCDEQETTKAQSQARQLPRV